MTSAATGSAPATTVRRRGMSKAPNFVYHGPVSVIRLELDMSDPRIRLRLQRQWVAVFRLRRALQRDAAARCRAFWAARNERARDPKALRARLGLTRKGIEAAAKAHIDASGWMRHHATKAIGLHVADEVWQTVDRHLFPDAAGRRCGPPRLGSWWTFTHIPGRARSHTKASQVWETWRLVGTLNGHLDSYRHPQLSTSVTDGRRGCTSILRRLHLDPTGTATHPGQAGERVMVGSHRCPCGCVHWTAGRRSCYAGAATTGRWRLGTSAAFSSRSQRLAQD